MESIGITTPKFTVCKEKPKSRLRRLLQWFNVLAAMFFMFGCRLGTKYPTHFEKTSGKANTFRLFVVEDFLFREHVKKIQVFEGGEDFKDTFFCKPLGQLCWEVVADPQVRAKRIGDVVAGQVPEGFIQKFPPLPEIFKPVPGKWYSISVSVTDYYAPEYLLTSWKAE